ncbi:MAG TPA: pyridoxal kinase PdxY [Rhizomicrobium sp.]
MNLLSIQSHVAYGHVGNSAAVFALQRLGTEVWPIHTVQFSNHTGYGSHKGDVFDAAMIREVFDGIAARGVLAQCDGVLSGYMASAATGAAILDIVARLRQQNPGARYCCDPVIGDVTRGPYVAPDLAAFIKGRALAAADLVTPNQFELGFLTGRATATLADLRAAVKLIHGRGPGVVLVTSLRTEETPDDALDVLVSDDNGQYRLRTPLLPIKANGAGDLMAALFFLHYLRTASPPQAMALAASALYGILRRTAEAGASEMLLIEAQDELVDPSRSFRPEAV